MINLCERKNPVLNCTLWAASQVRVWGEKSISQPYSGYEMFNILYFGGVGGCLSECLLAYLIYEWDLRSSNKLRNIWWPMFFFCGCFCYVLSTRCFFNYHKMYYQHFELETFHTHVTTCRFLKSGSFIRSLLKWIGIGKICPLVYY